MKIAVTYDNGNIFQHFGRTEYFKIYEIEDGQVLSSEVVSSNGSGHGALAGVLAGYGVDFLICGGMGGGAKAALSDAGIEVCTGITGDADEAVERYLKGELESAGVNCDHHHGEGHSCGDHGCGEHGCGGHGEEEGEEGGCGGCPGCGPTAIMEGKNVMKTCSVHYRGTFNDGTQFDSSYDRGEPLTFTCGVGQMIPGFDKAVADMEVGQIVDIHLMPEEAYGEKDPNAILSFSIDQLPGAENIGVGEKAYLADGMGRPFMVTVVAKDEETITFDANHEMAGKELNFRIELVSVE